MRSTLFAALLALVAMVAFGEGQGENPWRVVEGSGGELYLFTQAVTGCGMLSVDFIGSQRVEFCVNCDQTIDALPVRQRFRSSQKWSRPRESLAGDGRPYWSIPTGGPPIGLFSPIGEC